MKIYVLKNRLILTGKAWEIKQKLKEHGERHTLVKDWLESIHPPTSPQLVDSQHPPSLK